MVFLRPVGGRQETAGEGLTEERPISLREEENRFAFERQKSYDRFERGERSGGMLREDSVGLLERPGYGSVGKEKKRMKMKKREKSREELRNKELEKIYLGDKYREDYLNV